MKPFVRGQRVFTGEADFGIAMTLLRRRGLEISGKPAELALGVRRVPVRDIVTKEEKGTRVVTFDRQTKRWAVTKD